MLNGKHILIEDGDGVGDLIVVTPSLRKIKELYPDSVITFVTFGNCLDIISRLPYIDYSYALNNSFAGRLKSMKYISKQDYVIFRSYQPTLIRFAYYLNVPHRAGVCKAKYKDSNLWTVKYPMIEERGNNELMSEYVARQISEGLGINLEINTQCDVSAPTDEEMHIIREKLKAEGKDINKKYAVVAPFTRRGASLNYDIVVKGVECIKSRGYDCVMVNASKDPMITRITEELGENVYDLSGKTSLQDIVSLSKSATFGFSVDTGIMHVLCALKKPTLSIFTSGYVNWWAPREYCYPMSLNVSCSPCENGRECKDKKCVNGINPNDVVKNLNEMIDKL